MNSSISSFKTELKVVVAVLCVLVCIEIVMRAAETKLSIDIAHIRSGNEISARVGESERSVLILGNSLSRDGVDTKLIREHLGDAAAVEAYYPDGSSVNEWAYAFRRYFSEPGNAPDFLIIGAGRSHLFDSDLPAERFGAYFCSNRDLPTYFDRHVDSVDDAAGFLMARSSVAYTNRQRIQPRLFTLVIPHYKKVLPELQAKPREVGELPQSELKHRNLTELLQAAKDAGTRVVVVAIPMPNRYPLPDATAKVIVDGGAELIDARDLEGIGSENFPDNYHLDSAGAKLLTDHLIEKLQPLWWP